LLDTCIRGDIKIILISPLMHVPCTSPPGFNLYLLENSRLNRREKKQLLRRRTPPRTGPNINPVV
jgi:hypothetical protein